ncbi:hypothetical protein FSARC_6051 [Fusarium sarcochroum]|uniref:Uncharacterized protein n=1 Tax=Fusarium sarcochroum TaxID=1208366 RepID=A0A8H4TY90_9HYPO|nr:hypothetical protein FSARC_6051 [Fusarium sarcochroum]
MKSRRTHRSKSLPTTHPKKSFFSIISRRLSLSSMRRSNSVRLYDDSDDDDLVRVIPAEVQSPSTSSRISRRASRFWSASSSNQFEGDDSMPQSPTYSSFGGAAYVPRHAASDFSKTASNRLTVMAEADETTLCSFNCRTNRNTRRISTDDEFDVDHRERALAALTARRSIAQSSEGSNDNNNDYTLFLADAATGPDARHRRSAAAWAELEQRTVVASQRTSGSDPLISRQSRIQSTYLGIPGSAYESSRPASSVAVSISEYIRPVQVARVW